MLEALLRAVDGEWTVKLYCNCCVNYCYDIRTDRGLDEGKRKAYL